MFFKNSWYIRLHFFIITDYKHENICALSITLDFSYSYAFSSLKRIFFSSISCLCFHINNSMPSRFLGCSLNYPILKISIAYKFPSELRNVFSILVQVLNSISKNACQSSVYVCESMARVKHKLHKQVRITRYLLC